MDDDGSVNEELSNRPESFVEMLHVGDQPMVNFKDAQ